VRTLCSEKVTTTHNEAQYGARTPPSPCNYSELRPSAAEVDGEDKE